jgi:hypothetical protein
VNSEQVKSLLERVRPAPAPFQVVLSGKKSRKVHGLYKPEKREIILHNRNFTTEDELVYTALHEYAHHLQFCTPPLPRSARTHTIRFWSLFHGLLDDAERAGLYRSPFDRIEEFRRLTARIKEKIIAPNGALMKELGRLLAEAQELCEKHHASYTDYLDRVLALPKPGADAAVKSHLLDLDPRLGAENMKLVARVRDPEARDKAQKALLDGASHDTVKEMAFAPTSLSGFARPAPEEESLEALQAERKRLERTIRKLEKRLELVNERLQALDR